MRGVLAVVFFTFLISCDDSRVFEENLDIENKIWIADSAKRFQFSVKDTDKRYNLYFNLRNTVSYPYENIYVTYTLRDTLNNQLKKELINFNLFDPKTGKPFGSGLGDVFDHQLPILNNYKFDHSGPFVFQLQQYMRMDSLPEVISAGLRVERVKEE
jgi:gliding motility-associated lipoprotein GldH